MADTHKMMPRSFELRSADESEGRFTGLASVYGVVDLAGDSVVAGAFTKTIAENNGEVPILWNHKMDQPIGLGLIRPSHAGLVIEGHLDLDVPEGRRAFKAAQKAVLQGLSIGFETIRERKRSDGVRELVEIKLWEVRTHLRASSACSSADRRVEFAARRAKKACRFDRPTNRHIIERSDRISPSRPTGVSVRSTA